MKCRDRMNMWEYCEKVLIEQEKKWGSVSCIIEDGMLSHRKENIMRKTEYQDRIETMEEAETEKGRVGLCRISFHGKAFYAIYIEDGDGNAFSQVGEDEETARDLMKRIAEGGLPSYQLCDVAEDCLKRW